MGVIQSNLKIVGIGASAGGLEALEAFFRNVSEDSGATFIVIQHLSPDHKSMMPDLLGRITDIPVSLADDEIPLEPNHIYLIPGSKNIILKNDSLQFVDRAPINKLNLAIDIFFTSLANEKKEKAIGVILSGTGSDGTKGGQGIKEVGGTMFIQEPANIRFNGMPLSAISAGIADYILPIDELASEVLQYLNLIHNKYQILKQEDGNIIEDILDILKDGGNDFTSYTRQTLYRRMIKRVNLTKMDSLGDYKNMIESNEEEQQLLASEFLIGVTEFFRDPQHFKVIERKIIPTIFKKDDSVDLKAWVIACSTGEEAYSIAILINEYLEKNNITNGFKVFATDIDEEALEIASKGVYNKGIESDVKPKFLSTYFTKKGDTYIVKPALRKHIIFSRHNILVNPPFGKMDFVSCRNMLIYLQPEAQKRVYQNISFALNTSGYLLLGASESVAVLADHFQTIDKKAKIFQKHNPFDKSLGISLVRNEKFKTKIRIPAVDDVAKLADVSIKALAELTDSICVVFNTGFDILQLYGDFNKIATFPKDGFDLKAMKLNRLLPSEFNVPVSAAMITLNSKSEKTVKKTIVYEKNSESHVATFSINHLKTKKGSSKKFFLLVINGLEEKLENAVNNIKLLDSNKDDLKAIEQMLDDTRENLQATIEELETSNEESQATNEELVASNEELQSTNEELESVNEELNTVNLELEQRNVQLLEINADFKNLIDSSGTINLFLDKELKVRSFTESIVPIFNFLQADIGRELQNFSLPDTELIDNIIKVIDSQISITKEVKVNFQNKDLWYLQTIHPYRTTQDEIKGVVINYNDITKIKSTNQLLSSVLQTSPGAIYVFNLTEMKNEYSSPISSGMVGYTPEELLEMGDTMMQQLIHPEDGPKIMGHFETIKNSPSDEVQTCEYRFIKKGTTVEDKNPSYFLSYDLPMERDENNLVTKICGIALEVTDLKTTQIELENQNNLLSGILNTSPGLVYIFNLVELKVDFISPGASNLVGYSPQEIEHLGDQILQTILHPDDIMTLMNYFEDIKQANDNNKHQVEFRLVSKGATGDIEEANYFMSHAIVVERDADGIPSKICGFLIEITELKLTQIELDDQNKLLSNISFLSPSHTAITDAKTRKVKHTSNTLFESLGYKPKEYVGTDAIGNMERVMPRDILVKFARFIDTIVDNNVQDSYQIEVILKDQQEKPRWFNWSAMPYEWDSSETIESIIHFVQEITDLKESQIEIEKQNKLLNNITDISPYHTIISEARTHKPIFFTGTFLRSLDYGSMDNFPNLNAVQIMQDIMPAEGFTRLTEMLNLCEENNTQETYQIETNVYDKSGAVRWFKWSVKPYEWTDDKTVKSIIHFINEFTELKENQLKLEMINTELEEFSYVSSHDLQQPLNTLQSTLKVLMNELKEFEDETIVKKCLNIMSKTTTSMKQNIQSILDYSKVKSDISFQKIDLNEVLQTVLTTLSSIIQETDAKITSKQDLPFIKGDSHLVSLVFQNLITNAIKFQPNGNKPKIDIQYERSTTHEILHFKDNGIGISEKQQSRIFTLFQRLHEDNEYEGTGIGLAHANKIMRLHSGKIEVTSNPGKGSTFSCYFLRGNR